MRHRAGSRYRYRIDGELSSPTPPRASIPRMSQGPSLVVDPRAFAWRDGAWRGRPWHEAVIYELHVGTFTPEAPSPASLQRLDHFVELGVTDARAHADRGLSGRARLGLRRRAALRPGRRLRHAATMLKALIAAAHRPRPRRHARRRLQPLRPGRQLSARLCAAFFTERHHTPWGAAINFDGADSRTVRDFFIHNALYWLEEYHFDGLRFDAVHAICDDSDAAFLHGDRRGACAPAPGERAAHLSGAREQRQRGALPRRARRARHSRCAMER